MIWDHTTFKVELQWMLLSEMLWLGNNFERQINKTNSRPEWIQVGIFPISVSHTLHKIVTDFTSEIHTMAMFQSHSFWLFFVAVSAAGSEH